MTQSEPTPEPSRRRGLKRTAAQAGVVAWAALRVIRIVRGGVRRGLELVLALIILFEEWGWRPLAALLGRLARWRIIAALEVRIAALPPYPALLVFALPSLLLLPLKLLSLWLITTGHVVVAALLFIAAKIAGTALLARIFQLTQPKLMQLAWFARLYDTVMPWKLALLARVKASPVWVRGQAFKAAVRSHVAAVWAIWKPRVSPYLERLRRLLRPR